MYITQDDGVTKISAFMEGSLDEQLERRNFQKKTTLIGKNKKRWSDVYENITVNISRISETNYGKLKMMFRRPVMCEIYSEEGDIKFVSFSDSGFSLERFQDKQTNEFFRSGSLTFEE